MLFPHDNSKRIEARANEYITHDEDLQVLGVGFSVPKFKVVGLESGFLNSINDEGWPGGVGQNKMVYLLEDCHPSHY